MSEPDVAALAATIAGAAIGQGDLDAAIAGLHRLPATVPGRSRLAAGLVTAMMRPGAMPGPGQLRELDYLLALAEADPPADPAWPRHRTAARVAGLMRASAEGAPGDRRAALDRLAELEREGAGDPALRPLFEAARTGLGVVAAARPAPGDGLLDVAQEILAALDAVTGNPGGGPAGWLGDDGLAALSALATKPGLTDPERALAHAQVAAAALRGGAETDRDRVDLGIGHVRQAVDLTAPDDPQRVLHLTALALGLVRRDELTGTTAGRREARTLLVESRRLAGGPHHPHWQLITEMLTEINRLLGDTPA